MADLADGESVEMQGSGSKPYILRNVGGVYSCSCPAWRNQSVGIERRTCKHLKKLRGEAAESARINALPAEPGSTDEPEPADSSPAKPGLPLLLAESWTGDIDVTGWWMSEKLDGVRAYWNGSTFLSRLGNEFFAPDWFIAGFPTTPLDGELWLDRKKFQRAVSIVRRRDRSEHWRELKYVVFDLPEMDAPFEERTAHLADQFRRTPHPHALPHLQVQCRDMNHLRDELLRVEQLGGEGLMLRQPGSRYAVGRSSTLLKVKQFQDGEARVIEHIAGAGRHKGRLGALLCELADGKRFSIGTGFSDAQRAHPPGPGAIVQFRYQELSDGGIPRFPAFVGLRIDAVAPSLDAELQPARPSAPARSPSRGKRVKPADTASDPPVARGSVPPAAPSAGPQSAASPTPVSPPQGTPTDNSGSLRHFEFVEGGSSKFWEISRLGLTVSVRYGRIGTAGTTNDKTFASPELAQKHYDKLIVEKTGKGYVERK